MLTHDTGACVINNGGPEHDRGDNDDEDDQEDEPQEQNHGVIMRRSKIQFLEKKKLKLIQFKRNMNETLKQ